MKQFLRRLVFALCLPGLIIYTIVLAVLYASGILWLLKGERAIDSLAAALKNLFNWANQ